MISVIICTYNRSRILHDALSSFFDQDGLQQGDYELLVIDNNSTDDTEKVAKSFPGVKYVFEEALGISNARNRGVSESKGDLIAFADDDVLFSKNWLKELKDGAERWPDASAFGGKAVAKWEVSKPSWFIDHGPYTMRGMIGQFEPDLPEGVLPYSPYGCNMAFRASVFNTYEGFSPKFGNRGKFIICCDETELLNRISVSGGTIIYLPDMMVDHRVRDGRQHKGHYVRWMKAYQYTQSLLNADSETGKSFRQTLRNNRWVFRCIAERFGEWLWLFVTFRWSQLFSQQLAIIGLWEHLKWELSFAGKNRNKSSNLMLIEK